jgi:general secretion pathway protein I
LISFDCIGISFDRIGISFDCIGTRSNRAGIRSRCAGFTLLEVLVGLAIAAVALMASIRAVGSMAQTNAALELRALAQLSAHNRVAELRATGAFPAVGTRTAPCPQGRTQLQCAEETQPTPNPLFRRVEVRVAQPSAPGAVLARLTAVLPRVP